MAAAAADPAAPAAAAADPAAELSALYQDYQPGAPGDLFAPGAVRGLPASQNALALWNAANHPVTYGNIDQTRIPGSPPGSSTDRILADGRYGAGVPQTQVYGDPRGQIDPEALRVLAQGGHYDFNARRDAIAARIAANTPPPAPAAAAVAAPDTMTDEEKQRQQALWDDYQRRNQFNPNWG